MMPKDFLKTDVFVSWQPIPEGDSREIDLLSFSMTLSPWWNWPARTGNVLRWSPSLVSFLEMESRFSFNYCVFQGPRLQPYPAQNNLGWLPVCQPNCPTPMVGLLLTTGPALQRRTWLKAHSGFHSWFPLTFSPGKNSFIHSCIHQIIHQTLPSTY